MPQDQEQDAVGKHDTRKTILVVEDDADIAAFLALALAQETGYHPYVVHDSCEALEALKGIKPNLLILDYYLPRMNGLDFYDHLQATEKLAALPTIILTASLEQHQPAIEQRQLIGLGKPFELDDLLQTIEKILS